VARDCGDSHLDWGCGWSAEEGARLGQGRRTSDSTHKEEEDCGWAEWVQSMVGHVATALMDLDVRIRICARIRIRAWRGEGSVDMSVIVILTVIHFFFSVRYGQRGMD
jgi:hypothetical protein